MTKNISLYIIYLHKKNNGYIDDILTKMMIYVNIET